MAAMNAKRWVMAAVLAGGLTAGVGGVWSANAQEKPKPVQEQPGKPADPVKAELLQLQEMLKAEQAKRQDLEAQYKKQAADAKLQAAEAERAAKEKKPEWTKKNQEGKVPEFLYLHQKAGYSPNADELEKAVRPVEAKGYTFVGVVTMKWLDGSFTEQVVPTLVFRHTPVKGAADSDEVEIRRGVVTREAYLAEKAVEEKVLADRYAAKEKALRAEIEALTVELAELRKLQTPATGPQARLPLPRVQLPLTQLGGADDGSQLVTKLIRLRYGEKAAGGLSFDTSKDALLVSGLSKEQAGWLWETVYGLVGPMSSERK